MTLPSWQILTEDCLEDGWSEKDIASLNELFAFVSTFKEHGASKADVSSWYGYARGKRVTVGQLLDMAICHSFLVEEGERIYVCHTPSRLTQVTGSSDQHKHE